MKGHQVAPAELEGHLLGHPHVADAGVVGLPDEFAGELPLAFVALQPDIAAAVRRDPSAAENIRTSIAQVRELSSMGCCGRLLTMRRGSTCRRRRRHTSGSREG